MTRIEACLNRLRLAAFDALKEGATAEQVDTAVAQAKDIAEQQREARPGDSCTCPLQPGRIGPDCPVHRGRKPRGPKPPPIGPGCICDGSGRTCPRHGAVI